MADEPQIETANIMENLFDLTNSLMGRDPLEHEDFPEAIQRELLLIEGHLNDLFSAVHKFSLARQSSADR